MGVEIGAMLETSVARMIGAGILVLGVLGFVGAMFYGLVIIIVDAIQTKRLLRRLPKQKREELKHLGL